MIELRELEDEDAERLFLWRRTPAVSRWMCARPAPSFDEHLLWFQNLRDDRDSRGWIVASDGRAVGLVMLKGAADCDSRAEWGWYIGEDDARGRGVGRVAQALALDRAFGELGLHKLTAEILADNAAALTIQAAAGFRREGLLRAHVRKGGVYRDVIVLGLLAGEWAARREAYLQPLTAQRLIAA
jgi:UDP-4-amino-4,6-dideoxy-N-acetyl-beta-L-altrosamine N-acetyltransferase